VNLTKKLSVSTPAVFLVAWKAFPDWFDTEYFSVLLAALGTLILWAAMVILASWIFRVCGSFTRLMRKNRLEASSLHWPRAIS
jgi:hypothetical protein